MKGGGGNGVGEEPKYETEKAWSSINHLILSGLDSNVRWLFNYFDYSISYLQDDESGNDTVIQDRQRFQSCSVVREYNKTTFGVDA